MPWADVDGRTLYYEVEGEGPTVVFVHSGVSDHTLWDRQVEALRDRFRVLRYDAAGYGQSRLRPGPFSHLRDLHALLEQAGVRRASLVGCSLGGRIELEYALEHPEVVEALVLVAPGLPDHEWSDETKRAQDEEDEFFDAGDLAGAAEGQVRLWVDGPGRAPEAVDPALRERARRMILRSYELYLQAARDGEPGPGDRLDPPASTRLGELDVPTLIVVGDADVPDMLEIAAQLEAGIPGARKVIVPDAAHFLPLERPDELNRLLLDFLPRA